jgi:hypothetical protein
VRPGLDAAAAFFVVSAIKELTKGCRTIVAVIHQPASETFELFDKLCLLSAGSPIFFGDAAAGADFFAASGRPVPPRRSAPDHFLHAVNLDFETPDGHIAGNIKALADAFAASPARAALAARVEELHAHPGAEYLGSAGSQPGWLSQTATLTARTFLNNLRAVGVFWIRCARALRSRFISLRLAPVAAPPSAPPLRPRLRPLTRLPADDWNF